MGYRCPVCDDPQVDDTHLANHLAFTALVRGGEHEAWLDAEVPDWEQLGETELAAKLRGVVETVEFPQVFEDTTPVRTTEQVGDPNSLTEMHRSRETPHSSETHHSAPELDAEAQQAVERARELTRKRRESANQPGRQSEQDKSDE